MVGGHRIIFLCIILLHGTRELVAQSSAEQLIQNIQRGGIGSPKTSHGQIRFVSQPVQNQQTQFNQRSDLSPEQIRALNEQEAFRKAVAHANNFRTSSQPQQQQQQQQNVFAGQAQQQDDRQQTFVDTNNFNQDTVPRQQAFQQGSTQQFVPQQTQQFLPVSQPQQFTRTRVNKPQVFFRRPTTPNNPTELNQFTSNVQQFTPQENTVRNPDVLSDGGQSTFAEQNIEPQAPLRPRTNINRQRQRFQQTSSGDFIDHEEDSRQQAENAKYSFTSEVNDRINDHNHIRAETRDGLKLSGVYSYSDGFFKRTVHYEADENGYRVVKEDSEPIGDGPQTDPAGTADVTANVGGTNIQYSIKAEELPPAPILRQQQRS